MISVLVVLFISCNNTDSKVTRSNSENANASPNSGDQNSSDQEGSSFLQQCQSSSSDTNLQLQFQKSSSLSIVGGETVDITDPLALSTVKVILPGGHCTGTIIKPNKILTAAHCLQVPSRNEDVAFLPDPRLVTLGFGLSGNTNSITIDSFAVHPCYRGILGDSRTQRYIEKNFYDVAILSFSGDLPSGYKPVSVASPSELQSSSSITLAGYGQYSEQDPVSRPLTKVGSTVKELNQFNEIQLEVTGRGACYGDSGGPAYLVKQDGSLVLAGSITGPSRASPDYLCDSGSGTLMNLTKYLGWIKCTLDKLGENDSNLPSDNSQQFCSATQLVQ